MYVHECVLVSVYVCVHVTLCDVPHNPQIFHFAASIVRGREHRNSWCTLLHLQTHTHTHTHTHAHRHTHAMQQRLILHFSLIKCPLQH